MVKEMTDLLVSRTKSGNSFSPTYGSQYPLSSNSVSFMDMKALVKNLRHISFLKRKKNSFTTWPIL
jgi:hypothetical protein